MARPLLHHAKGHDLDHFAVLSENSIRAGLADGMGCSSTWVSRISEFHEVSRPFRRVVLAERIFRAEGVGALSHRFELANFFLAVLV